MNLHKGSTLLLMIGKKGGLNQINDEICKFIVACNAVFVMYRRGMWTELTSLGFIRKVHEKQFHDFDMKVIISERGYIRHIKQTVKLVEYCPYTFIGACKLLAVFKKVEQLDEQFRAACLSYLSINGFEGESVVG